MTASEQQAKQLDCLLISPSIFYDDTDSVWKEINSNFPPLGLASIAGVVRERGFSVAIIDCNIDAPCVSQFETAVLDRLSSRYAAIRFIGITAFSFNVKKAYQIAALCKNRFPGSTIVFGGVHATAMPDDVMKQDVVDVLCFGEGELTILELLQNKPRAAIAGIWYRTADRGIAKNEPRERITDLDALPMPAYDLLPIRQYRPAKGSYKRLPAMSMMTSRGCPGECTFCFKTLGKRLVFRSAEKIYDEILYLIKNYGIKQLMFYDDTFTVYKKNVLRLCELLIANRTDVTWTCFARVDYVDAAMLKTMARAGCHQIMYGVENINPTVLQNIRKRITKEQVVNSVRWTKEAGIECRLAFMIGNPGDTAAIIEENIAFVTSVNPDVLIINITTPLPGTEMFRWAHERGLILSYDWDDYTFAVPVMKLANLTVEEIKALYKRMYRAFYFRPAYVAQRIRSIRSLEDVKRLWEGFKALCAFLRPGK